MAPSPSSATAQVETSPTAASVVALRVEPTAGDVVPHTVQPSSPLPAQPSSPVPAQPSSPIPASTLEPVGAVSTAVESVVAEPRAIEPEATPASSEMTTAPSLRASDATASRQPIVTHGDRVMRGPARGNGRQQVAASPLGLGLVGMRIRLDGAATRTTSRDTHVISGTLIGGTPRRVVVDVDGRQSEPTLDGRLFATTVQLVPGLNQVRVLATDALGARVEEAVTVEYVPPLTADITLTSPRDGDSLTPGAPPLVAVEGQVSDSALTAVWLVANERRLSVPVSSGRFAAVLPALEPVVRIRAETSTERRGTAPVTVHASGALPAIAIALLDWPRDAAGSIELSVSWRSNPAKLDGVRALPLSAVTSTGASGLDLAYLRDARPGVYTFVVTYRAGTRASIRPVLSLSGAAHTLPPVTVDGSGRAVIARVLLPQGVLWEQDDWFTGRGASGDIVTKFRFPDGVSWSERVGDASR